MGIGIGIGVGGVVVVAGHDGGEYKRILDVQVCAFRSLMCMLARFCKWSVPVPYREIVRLQRWGMFSLASVVLYRPDQTRPAGQCIPMKTGKLVANLYPYIQRI